MKAAAPWLTLSLLLAASAAVLGGGVALARHAQTVRLPRDRAPLVAFAADLRQELQRLEQLYETHVQELAREAPLTSEFELRQACQGWYYGVRQFSLLRAPKARHPDWHVATDPRESGRLPQPVFVEEKNAPRLRPQVRVPAERLLADTGPDAGWLDAPGQPLLFWCRRPGREENAAARDVVVLLPDVPQIATRINGWLRPWLAAAFEPVRVTGGPDELTAPDGTVLAAVGVGPAAAGRPRDFLLPVRSRFGTWQLATWDRCETRVSYHLPTLYAAAALAMLVALVGVLAFVQQQRAVRLAEQRVSFVNRVSHELRTPLTNILLNADLVADAVAGQAPAAARRLALLREEAQRLGRLIANVLTFSRREQGRLQLTPGRCVPAAVLADVLAQFAPALERRGIRVQVRGAADTPCHLDADALAQILTNLVSNVEKYAAAGGRLDLTAAQSDGQLVITVADRGPGIPPREAERIFEPFHRLHDAANEGASGTGLGLAIARDLAGRLGGALRLLPSETGATFELRVPTAPTPPGDPA